MLAQGDKVALAIEVIGNAHPIARLLASEAKARGQKLPASAVKVRMKGLVLPTIEQAKMRILADFHVYRIGLPIRAPVGCGMLLPSLS